MTKPRSPDYPAIGLGEAIQKIEKVWKKDYQNKVPKQVVAEHMGYTSLNGSSLPIISALSKYGLLDGRGDDTYVSDLALQIVAHAPGTPERMSAVKQAAAMPELFVDLSGKFPGGKGSDAAMRSYLITQKFIPSAADAAIRAYRDTLKLVDAESQGHNGESHAAPEGPRMSEPQQHVPPPAPRLHQLPAAPTQGVIPAPMRVAFDGTQIEVAAVLADVAAVDRLIRALQANRPLLESAQAEPPPQSRDDDESADVRRQPHDFAARYRA